MPLFDDPALNNPPQAPAPTPTSTLGDLFRIPAPSEARAADWGSGMQEGGWGQNLMRGFQAAAGGILAARDPNYQIKMAEDRRRNQEVKIQMGRRLLEGFTDLLNAPPNISGPAWDAFVKAGGYDPKDPNIQLLGKTFGKLDPQQREAFKSYLNQIGAANPDRVIDFVAGLTRNPAMMLKLMNDVSQHQAEQTAQGILSGEAFGGPAQQPQQAQPQDQMPEQLAGPPPEPGTLGQMIAPQQAPAQPPPPPPTLEEHSALLTQGISQLNAVIGALDNQRSAILQTVKNPAVRKQALDEINQRTTAIRTRIGQLETQRRDIFAQQKEETNKQQFERREARMEKAALDQERRSLEIQDRIDARAAEYRQSITDRMFERPLEPGDREAIGAMEENLRVAQKLRDGFTPQERAKFVGILRMPAQQAAQFFRDPNSPEARRFGQFRTLTNEVRGFAFAEGGKQLTNTEKAITWGHLPVGNEFSVADYVANLDRTIERTNDLINRRIELATSPRKRVTPRFTTPSQTGGGAAPKTAGEYLKKFNAQP